MLPARRRSGFSLLEWLVVAGVVGVLAVLLLPVISRVRAAGSQAECAGHLKQIITAYLIRISDNSGRFPPSRTGREYDPTTGGTRLAANTFMHNMLGDYIPNPTAILNQPGAVPRDAGVYWCPGRNASATSLTVPNGQGAIYSYAHNTELGGTGSQPTLSWLGPNGGDQPNAEYNPGLARLAAVPFPSKIIAFTEQTLPGSASAGHLLSSSWPFQKNASWPPPASGRQLDFTRHGGRVNAAFLDGSVRAMSFEELRGTRTEFLVPVIE
ncbi:MAG TPA: H-X9-DG-CTERM domain-containing protein [Chthoniobacteraceae bacterium]|nr:H-X9-DG-CTERM domain-containing protein [Chthoniobacteraceae bacterium]